MRNLSSLPRRMHGHRAQQRHGPERLHAGRAAELCARTCHDEHSIIANVVGRQPTDREQFLNLLETDSAADRDAGRQCHGAISALSTRSATSARAAPITWQATKPGTLPTPIPAKVLVKPRASVTAGFAKEVDAVNQ